MPLIPQVGRNKINARLILITISALLWVGILLHLFSWWWMVSNSFKLSTEIYKLPPTLYPHSPTLIAYKAIFRLGDTAGVATSAWISMQFSLWTYLKNSVLITGITMLLQVSGTALVAYSLSKLQNPRWSRVLFFFFIGTMLVPFEVALIPNYLILRNFPFPLQQAPNIPFTNIKFPSYNFINTYAAAIIPVAFSPFYMLLFKGFFDGIPDSLIHAARLDGSSEGVIFRKIIIPLSKPVFAVVAYFSFVAAWNQFLWPMIVLRKERLYPLAVQIYKLSIEIKEISSMSSQEGRPVSEEILKLLRAGFGYNGLMALALVESIPVFIMFVIFREQLMKGIKLRGFK